MGTTENESGGSDVDSTKTGSSLYSKNQSGAKTVYGDYVLVEKEHCRVIHETTVGYKNVLIGCLHNAECRSNIGGSHKSKREDDSNRIKPGIYKKVLRHKKLAGADPESEITEEQLQELIEFENRKEAQLLAGISDMDISDKKKKKKESSTNSPSKILSFDRNQGIISPSQSVRSAVKKRSKANKPKPATTASVKTESELEALEQKLLESPKSTKNTTKVEVETASEDEKEHAKYASVHTSDSSGDDTSIIERSSSDESSAESSVSEKKPRKKSSKKKKKSKAKSTQVPKLYIVTHGHGGDYCVGFYREHWNKIEFITKGCKGSRVKQVRDETEGLSYVKGFFEARDQKPLGWMKKKQPFYPNLKKVRKLVDAALSKKTKVKHEPDSSDSSSSTSSSSDSSSDDGSDPYDSDSSGGSSDSSSDDGSSSSSESSLPSSSSSSSDGGRRRSSRRQKHKKAKKSKKKKGKRSKKSKKRKSRSTFRLKERFNVMKTDPSTGKGTELFKVSLNNHSELIRKLTPKGLHSKGSSLLFDQIDDFTAYPKNQGKSGDNEAVREFAEIAAQTIHRGRAHWSSFSKDNGYQDNSRNVLGNLKRERDPAKFRELTSNYAQATDDLLERFKGKISSVLQHCYRIDGRISDNLTPETLVHKIGKATLEYWKSFLNHHIALLATSDWSEVQTLLLYHSKKLFDIRTSYNTRAQVMCRIYTYLRDGSRANWTSIKMVQDQLLRYATGGLGSGTPGGGTNTSGGRTNGEGGGSSSLAGEVFNVCPHCKTKWVHGIDKTTCPFASLTRKKAVNAGKKALLQLIGFETPNSSTSGDGEEEKNDSEIPP